MTIATGDYAADVAESARTVFERETPRDETLHRLRSEALSAKAWKAAAEAGWFRLLAPGSAGGIEAGAPEVAALFHEVGRYLPAGPFAETVVVAGLVRSFGEIGPDESVVTFGALDGASGPGGVTGTVEAVEHGEGAGVLLVRAGANLIAVDMKGPGVRVESIASFDLVGRPARVVFDGAKFEELPHGAEVLERAPALLDVARAATLAGIARELVDMSVQYARDRVQFDKPIGSFQAVQHRLADMAVSAAGIDSAVGAVVAASASERAGETAALSALAAELTRQVAYSALQVHGGIGFTDAHRLHAYLKRALRLQAIVSEGDPLAGLGARLLAGS